MNYRHIIIISGLVLMLALALPNAARATLSCPAGVDSTEVEKSWIALQVPIPNITVTCTDDNGVTKDYVKDMGAYIGGLYKYFVGVIGVLAAVMVFYGGLRWLTAAGNASRVKDAKETIFAALIAIVIAFGSYLLLYTISPDLVKINPPVLKVADTFLVNFGNFCSENKVCLSGTNAGNVCTTDAACPGASAGACGMPLIFSAGETQPTCGKQYDFMEIKGVKNATSSCTGYFCEGTKNCVKGHTNGSVFTPDSVNGTEYGCADPIAACQAVTDEVDGVGPGRHDELCKPLSISGQGLCQWYEPGSALFCSDLTSTDHCKWYSVLKCPSDYPVRVNGGVCERESVSDDYGTMTFSNGVVPIFGSCYKASSQDVVYDGTLASTGQVLKSQCDLVHPAYNPALWAVPGEGICCMKASADPATATPADLRCEVSN